MAAVVAALSLLLHSCISDDYLSDQLAESPVMLSLLITSQAEVASGTRAAGHETETAPPSNRKTTSTWTITGCSYSTVTGRSCKIS